MNETTKASSNPETKNEVSYLLIFGLFSSSSQLSGQQQKKIENFRSDFKRLAVSITEIRVLRENCKKKKRFFLLFSLNIYVLVDLFIISHVNFNINKNVNFKQNICNNF